MLLEVVEAARSCRSGIHDSARAAVSNTRAGARTSKAFQLMDEALVAVIMRFGATSLKSFSTSFPVLALLKSGSDGLLRTLPSSPSSTNPQTAHSVNSQTEKRTGSRKKTAETARGQDQNGGDTGQNGQGECEEQAIIPGHPSTM